MSKKELRARLAEKQQEIERLQLSLVQAEKHSAQSRHRLQSASREDQLAARGSLVERAERDRQSVKAISDLLQRARLEAEEIGRELRS